MLKNALVQTGYAKEIPDESNWRNYLYSAVEKIEWETVKKDVENFLENTSDVDVFTKENVLGLINKGK